MKQLMNTNDYEGYLKKQWKMVDRIYELKLFSKHIDIIEQFLQIYPEDTSLDSLQILCVGARYGIEMLAFEQLGFKYENIKAIDIYPRNEQIINADMHDMPFGSNCFDIIYSHHSLDHSLFPEKALSEIKRVSTKDSYWLLTIPYNDFGKEESIDFDTAEEVESYVTRFKSNILYRKAVTRNADGFVEPKDTWLPKGWKNEIRLIVN